MMHLQFLGDWSWPQGLLFGLCLAGLSVWLYRRELRGQRRLLRIALPGLRGLVVFLLVLMLTGPVLHHRERVGEQAHVRVVIDATASMGLRDPALASGRKLLLAQRLGLLTGELPRPDALAAAEGLAAARAAATAARESPETEPLQQAAAALATAIESGAAALQETDAVETSRLYKPGVHWACWANIPGTTVDALKTSERYRGPPTEEAVLDRVEVRANLGDNYGSRLRGFLVPPETGRYVLQLMSDDQGELWLSENAGAEGVRLVARVASYVGLGEWGRTPEQQSAPIELVAGRRYYFEGFHKEGQGGDFFAVGWRLPSGRVERPISGASVVVETGSSMPDWTQRVAQLRVPVEEGDPARAFASLLQQAVTEGGTLEATLRRAFDAAVDARAAADAPTAEAMRAVEALTRWQRLQTLLMDGQPSLLARLAQAHDVDLSTLDADGVRPVWSSRAGRWGRAAEAPLLLDGAPDGLGTDLVPALTTGESNSDRSRDRDGTEAQSEPRTVVVLISDGGHNDGESPIHPAKILGSRGSSLFTVGMGAPESPLDVAVAEIEAPATVFHQDRVAGRVSLLDQAKPGQSFRLVAMSGEDRLWEQALTTQGGGQRWVPYDFSVEAHVAALAVADGSAVTHTSRPLTVAFVLEGLTDDAEPRNNQRPVSLQALTQKRKLLLVEGRPRWEWRFVHSLFSRDERWEVTRVLSDGRELPRGEGIDRFPPSREALFAYDLIILGEVPTRQFKEEELEWTRDFVSDRGGGLVLLDGRRGVLRTYADTALKALLPVRWREGGALEPEPQRLQLTTAGSALAAFQLSADREGNAAVWHALPRPRGVVPVDPAAGAEVLVEAAWADRTNAVVVTRRFGAGRMLHLATDELWRWRFADAGVRHQRFWHQAVEWIMDPPFPVQDAHVALDAGAAQYAPGEQAALRVRIRDAQGRPLPKAKAWALLARDGVPFAEVPLSEDDDAGGRYRAVTPALPAGTYTLTARVQGLPAADTGAKLRIEVAPRDPGELTTLAANPALLQELAGHARGAYLPEERINELESLLQPLSQGKTIERHTLLWQSYPWFLLVVALLTCEWIWRRKAGLL